MGPHRYLIALGSNVRHHRHGRPERVIRAALAALEEAGVEVTRASDIIATAPLGPPGRQYANAVVAVEAPSDPPALLALLKAVERRFGRRRGKRWGPRVLDLDVVLWDGGCWSSPGLTIPHIAFRERAFVLAPAKAIAPLWRDPLTGQTLRQLHFHVGRRLTRPAPLPR